MPLSQPALRAAGGALGAGILIALPVTSCGLAETARVVRYLAEESAGQCGPCVFGLPALADALVDLAYQGGRGGARTRSAAARRLIEGRGACRHPDGATQLVRSALRAFSAEVQPGTTSAARAMACGGDPLLPVPGDEEREGLEVSIKLRVNPITCDGHGICAELLPEIITLDQWGYPILAPARCRVRSSTTRSGPPPPARPWRC